MCRGQPRAELPRNLDPLVHRQPADAPEQRGEVFAVHVLHRQIELAVRLADVVDAADVGMGDLPGEAHLRTKPGPRGRVRPERGEELQRDRLAELGVVPPVDLAHAFVAQGCDDPETIREERAGAEAPFVDDAGRGGRSARGAEAVGRRERRVTGRTHARPGRWRARGRFGCFTTRAVAIEQSVPVLRTPGATELPNFV
jgi:hypothetical protein